jgi:hypothetical protein
MSKKLATIVGGTLLMVAFLAGTMQGCGGGDGSDPRALCNQTCDKLAMCSPDLAPFLADCKAQCSMSSTGGQRCTNEAAMVSAFKACLAMTCENFLTCEIPDCQGGAGGTGGGGGSTGQGGAGGAVAGDCSVCTKAASCCNALPNSNPTDCAMLSAANCTAAGANQAQYIQACQLVITGGASLPDPPQACL